MTNIYQIDEETLSNLPEEVKSKLQQYQPEDVEGLKRTANDLLGEKKAVQAREAEALAKLAKIEADMKRSKVVAPGDDAKLADAMAQLDAARNEINSMKKAVVDGKLDAQASVLAAKINEDCPRKQALLKKEILNRLQYEGDALTVLNDNGQATISSVDDLLSEMRTKWDFLATGTKATGGNALGGNARKGASSKKFTDYSGAELSAIRKETPQEYDRLVREHKGV